MILRLLITILPFFLFSQCISPYHIGKDLKDTKAEYVVFFSKYVKGGYAYYVVDKPDQIEVLKKKLKLHEYKGRSFEKEYTEFIFICRNHVFFKEICVHKTNIEELFESLNAVKLDERKLSKDSLISLVKTLESDRVPYFIKHDTISYNFKRTFTFTFLEPNFASVNKTIRIAGKIEDSIETLLKIKYPDRGVRCTGGYIGGGVQSVNFTLGVRDESDLKGLEDDILNKVKSIKKVSVSNMSAMKYDISFAKVK